MLSSFFILFVIIEGQTQITLPDIIGWIIPLSIGIGTIYISISAMKKERRKINEEKNATKEYVDSKIYIIEDKQEEATTVFENAIKNVHGRIKENEHRNEVAHRAIKDDISREINTRFEDIREHIDTRFDDMKDLIKSLKNENN